MYTVCPLLRSRVLEESAHIILCILEMTTQSTDGPRFVSPDIFTTCLLLEERFCNDMEDVEKVEVLQARFPGPLVVVYCLCSIVFVT